MYLCKTLIQAITVGAFTSLCTCGYAQTTEPAEVHRTDTSSTEQFVIHFRVNSSLLLLDYRSNQSAFEKIDTLFKNDARVADIDSVVVTAASSPDGRLGWNEHLASERARSLATYLKWRFPNLRSDKIATHAVGEDWLSLQQLVEKDFKVPARERVIEILSASIDSDNKKRELRALDGGVPYRYIIRYISPYVRSAVGNVTFYLSSKQGKEPLTFSDSQPAFPVMPQPEAMPKLSLTPDPLVGWMRKPLLAVKTNLLFDAVSALNIELEVPIGNRFSLAGEWVFPWWLWKKKQYCLQVLSGTVEGRYWLGKRENRQVLTGWFGGLYAGGGLYDLEWEKEGIQGEFYIAAGVSAGYAHKIARNLRMEYSLGIGYLGTNYRRYIPRNNGEQLVWQNDGQYTFIGPTRLKVSLVWLLHYKVKERGEK